MLSSEETLANPMLFSPLALAFLGDSYYELLVRRQILAQGNASANQLHKKAVRFVCAKGQCLGWQAIEALLDEEETAIFKRGRNANAVKSPKHTNQADYRRATGVEALFGYLYLTGRTGRAEELFKKMYHHIEELLELGESL